MSIERPKNIWATQNIGYKNGIYDDRNGYGWEGNVNLVEEMKDGDVFYIGIIDTTKKRDKLRRCVKPFKITLLKKTEREVGHYDSHDFTWDSNDNPNYFKTNNAESDLFRYGILCKTMKECEMLFDREIREKARGQVHSVSEKMLAKQVSGLKEIDQLKIDAETWLKKLGKVERRYVQKLIDLDK